MNVITLPPSWCPCFTGLIQTGGNKQNIYFLIPCTTWKKAIHNTLIPFPHNIGNKHHHNHLTPQAFDNFQIPKRHTYFTCCNWQFSNLFVLWFFCYIFYVIILLLIVYVKLVNILNGFIPGSRYICFTLNYFTCLMQWMTSCISLSTLRPTLNLQLPVWVT